ncbi:MAG: class I SAM-dependent methyltransferase [Burkholderiaceae bacterium]|nr:class I SAM-dependent methyltransferase [Burkholderiaceae bacterium]
MKQWLDTLEMRLAQLPVALALHWPGGRAGPPQPDVALRFHGPRALAALALGRLGDVGRAIVEGEVELEGSVRALMQAATGFLAGDPAREETGGWPRLRAWLRSVRVHSPVHDARQVQFHYDLSDDFYALWLDPRRVYSCAYFRTPELDLAAAQEAKLDHICRKLQLAPGERFLDIGAGWGGLLLWAAERYGVQATGITLSRHQHAFVQQRIAERGLQGRARMELCDYRQFAPAERFDKLASVGMLEHVGRAQMRRYFDTVHAMVRPGGLVLNHGITAAAVGSAQLGAGLGEFIDRYIFPGGELLHVSDLLEHTAAAGLEMVDTENLRPHYARTLWAWSDALEQQLGAAREVLCAQAGAERGERALRAYRLYLAGSALGFEQGWMALHQMLSIRPNGDPSYGPIRGAQSDYPFTRDALYSRPAPCSTSSNPAPPAT